MKVNADVKRDVRDLSDAELLAIIAAGEAEGEYEPPSQPQPLLSEVGE